MNIGDIIVSLVQALAWPSAAVFVAFLFRKYIPNLMKALGSRISGVSVGVVSLEFAAVQPNPEILDALEYISKALSPDDIKEHISDLLVL